VEKAVKKTAKAAAETAEKSGQAVSEAAAETVAKAAGAVKEAAAKVEKKAEAAAKPAAKKAKGGQADMKKLEGMPRLKKRYLDEIAPALRTKFAYENVMQIPRLEKVIINMGLGSDKDNPRASRRRSRNSAPSPARERSSPAPRRASRTSRSAKA
jgi:hypothetical protein